MAFVVTWNFFSCLNSEVKYGEKIRHRKMGHNKENLRPLALLPHKLARPIQQNSRKRTLQHALYQRLYGFLMVVVFSLKTKQDKGESHPQGQFFNYVT